jgi:hypothetical protein
MSGSCHVAPPHPAIVARSGDHKDLYLRMSNAGVPTWIDDPVGATAFASMREAMRASLQLPGGLRAFALPSHLNRQLQA